MLYLNILSGSGKIKMYENSSYHLRVNLNIKTSSDEIGKLLYDSQIPISLSLSSVLVDADHSC